MPKFRAKKVICDSMGIVKIELTGTKENVRRIWEGLYHTIDSNYTIHDFFYPLEEGSEIVTIAESFPDK